MAYFPFFMELGGKEGLILGGGTVALRKIEKLLPFGPVLTVVAPEILPQIREISGLKLCQRPFAPADIHAGLAFVIAATDAKEENQRIAALCQAHRIPVNVVDDPKACTFLFPALVQRGKLTVGISTAGASPTAAVRVKEQIRDLLPEGYGDILEYLEEKRIQIKAALPEKDQGGALRSLCDACLKQGGALSEDGYAKILQGKKAGKVSLVGAGCGKADLLTLRALRLLRGCDVVVYDDLIDPEILQMAPESARRIYMGKRCGCHAASQEEISAALVKLGQEGWNVVRLKGGDPFVFGRGGEEALALKEAGVPFQVVPGISSAIAIPEEAGIPVTHRGLSREVHIITAHTAGEDGDYKRYGAMDGTQVFLMGLSRLEMIAAQLISGGKSPETPAAVISGGNAPVKQSVRGTLGDIADKAKDVRSPAVILVGDVAKLELFNP